MGPTFPKDYDMGTNFNNLLKIHFSFKKMVTTKQTIVENYTKTVEDIEKNSQKPLTEKNVDPRF